MWGVMRRYSETPDNEVRSLGCEKTFKYCNWREWTRSTILAVVWSIDGEIKKVTTGQEGYYLFM